MPNKKKRTKQIKRRRLTPEDELTQVSSAELLAGYPEGFAGLLPGEVRFVINYFTTANLGKGKAAIQAGYSPKSAHVTASIMLRRPRVRALVLEIIKDKVSEFDLIERYKEIANYDPEPFYKLQIGEKTLDDLRNDGVDVTLITQISERPGPPDQHGNPTVDRTVKLMSKERAQAVLLDLYNTKPDTQLNVDNRTVNVYSNTPGSEQRLEAAGQAVIDVEPTAVLQLPEPGEPEEVKSKKPKGKVLEDYIDIRD